MFKYTKSCNLIGWIVQCGRSIHFRIDGPDRLYGFRLQLKHESFGKMGNNVSAVDREMLDMLGKLAASFQENLKR